MIWSDIKARSRATAVRIGPGTIGRIAPAIPKINKIQINNSMRINIEQSVEVKRAYWLIYGCEICGSRYRNNWGKTLGQ